MPDRFAGSRRENDQPPDWLAQLIGRMLIMRLYGAIQKVEPQDDGTVKVHGIASSEVMDDQGEIVRADAIRAAIPDYMRFPALREMHQLAAAGTTLEAEVGDDGVTRIVAHVVDPIAIAKVKNQVYRGFSIGGRIIQRETGNPKVVTGLVLNEISLVDRPANPAAVFDCWKASAALDPIRQAETRQMAVLSSAPEPFNPPIQVWACGVADHHHRGKAEATKCLESRTFVGPDDTPPQTAERLPGSRRETDGATTAEARIDAAKGAMGPAEGTLLKDEPAYADPGFQPDGKRRYPIDTERHIRAAWGYINTPSNAERYTAGQIERVRAAIIAAWKDKIDAEGPPSAEKASSGQLTKLVLDAGRVAQVILELDWLADVFEVEAVLEGDGWPQPARLPSLIAELRGSLNTLLGERMDELQGSAEIGDESPAAAPVGALPEIGNSTMQTAAAAHIAKGKHPPADQALADIALFASDKCLNTDGLSAEDRAHLVKVCDHLRGAGASSPDTPSVGGAKGSNAIGPVAGERDCSHQNLMGIAHECIGKLTGGRACIDPPLQQDFGSSRIAGAGPKEAAGVGAHDFDETMAHLCMAHRHLVAAGAECSAMGIGEEERQGTKTGSTKTLRAEELTKALAEERAAKTELVKALSEMIPLLDRLSKRVDDIANTPLPPLTIAKGAVSVSKQQDSGNTEATGNGPLSREAIASALAKMSKEEQTLTLIKASHANPMPVPGAAAER
jgi:hypothetical protein